MSNLTLFVIALLALGAPALAMADREEDQQLLKRMYDLRMRFERDRQRSENEARANVRLVTQSAAKATDSPTVTALRTQTNQQLARFEQSFRCLDVDVENNGGNTVVICGSNGGDIEGTNVEAGRDIVTVQGGGQ